MGATWVETEEEEVAAAVDVVVADSNSVPALST